MAITRITAIAASITITMAHIAMSTAANTPCTAAARAASGKYQ